MHQAESLQFSFVDQIQGPPKSGKIAEFRERIKEVEQLQNRVGGILPQIFAAGVLNVSPERVSQLVDKGKLDVVMLHKTPFVTMRSLVAYGETERKAGRPMKKPSLMEIAKSSWEAGKQATRKKRPAKKLV